MSIDQTVEQVGQIQKFDRMTNEIRDFQESPAFKLLVKGLTSVANDFYKVNSPDGDLKLDDTKAKDLSNKLWDTATQMVAVNYLKLNDEKIKALKDTKNPADGNSGWDNLMTSLLGTDKETLYRTINTRQVVKPQELDALVKPVYDNFANSHTSKLITKEVKDLKTAQALVDYAVKIKEMYPKAAQAVNINRNPADTREATQTYAQMIQVPPRDVKVDIAAYRKAA